MHVAPDASISHHFFSRSAPLLIPADMSPECTSLVASFLSRNPVKRLGSQGMADIRNHQFFTSVGFDWERLEARKLVPPLQPGAGAINVEPRFARMPIYSDSTTMGDDTVDLDLPGFDWVRRVDRGNPSTAATTVGAPNSTSEY